MVARLNAVNSWVRRLGEKGKQRVVHINTFKACVDREERVYRLTVVAEGDDEGSVGGVSLLQVCKEYKESDIEAIKEEFRDVLRDEPGNTESAVLSLELSDHTPIQQMPYRVPERLKSGVRDEIDGLLDAGIVVPSTSPP